MGTIHADISVLLDKGFELISNFTPSFSVSLRYVSLQQGSAWAAIACYESMSIR